MVGAAARAVSHRARARPAAAASSDMEATRLALVQQARTGHRARRQRTRSRRTNCCSSSRFPLRTPLEARTRADVEHRRCAGARSGRERALASAAGALHPRRRAPYDGRLCCQMTKEARIELLERELARSKAPPNEAHARAVSSSSTSAPMLPPPPRMPPPRPQAGLSPRCAHAHAPPAASHVPGSLRVEGDALRPPK